LSAIVTFTVLPPPDFDGTEWLHAATDKTAIAANAVAVKHNSCGRHLTWEAGFAMARSPLLFRSPATAADRGHAGQGAGRRECGYYQRKADSPELPLGAIPVARRDLRGGEPIFIACGGPVGGSPPTLTVLGAASPPPLRTAVRLLTARALTIESPWASMV
jgi:hypothetical protein